MKTIQSSDKVWGKLTSINGNFKNTLLTKSVYTIGRGNGNDIIIDDIRLSSVHCILTKDENDIVVLEDMSSNGTYIGNERIGRRHSRILLPGENIYLLHSSRVFPEEILGFVFSIVMEERNPLKRIREYEPPELVAEMKQLKSPERTQDYNRCCCKCLESKCHLVMALPCLHTFCARCYSEWIDQSINCPKCCEEVIDIIKNTPNDNFENIFVKEKFSTIDKAAKQMDCLEVPNPSSTEEGHHTNEFIETQVFSEFGDETFVGDTLERSENSDDLDCVEIDNPYIIGKGLSEKAFVETLLVEDFDDTEASTNENSRNAFESFALIALRDEVINVKLESYYNLYEKFTAR